MQAPTSKRQSFRKNISLFCNSIVGVSIARPVKPCAAARPLGWSRAPPAFAVSANPKISSRTFGGPAMQAPTSKRQGLCKNSIALSKFHRRGEHCSPALAAAASPKISPRTVGGPAMQAPTSKGQGLRKNISLFCDSIVGASIARPLRPCAAARPLGWSRAPPLPWAARECA